MPPKGSLCGFVDKYDKTRDNETFNPNSVFKTPLKIVDKTARYYLLFCSGLLIFTSQSSQSCRGTNREPKGEKFQLHLGKVPKPEEKVSDLK